MTFLTFVKNGRFLDLIINFENTASHKYLVQKSKSLWMARSEMTEYSYFVLIQKWHIGQTLFWKLQLQTFIV